jgi:hypothetical protein
VALPTSTQGTDGSSLQVTNTGYHPIVSDTFDTWRLRRVGTSLLVDVFIPYGASWIGTLELALTVPEPGIYDEPIGLVNLNGLPAGQWSTVSVAVSQRHREALLGDYAKARLKINLNTGVAAVLLDNLRFGGILTNRAIFHRADIVPVATTPVLGFEEPGAWSSAQKTVWQEVDPITSKTDGESPPEWSDRESGALALLRIAPGRFSDGRTDAPLGDYHRLSPNLPASQTHFRFVGPYLLYGARDVVPRAAYTIRYAHPDDMVTLPLTHHVETIEPLGQNAVVVGSDGFRLLATRIALGREPQVDGSTSISSGTRSYRPPTKAFYFAAEGAQTTLFGLPTTDPNRIYYLESGPQRLRPIGLLNGPKASGDDLSCPGWPYAVTPVFADGRVFGLVGNEIVELRRSSEDGFLTEYRRVSLVSDFFATRTANPATP